MKRLIVTCLILASSISLSFSNENNEIELNYDYNHTYEHHNEIFSIRASVINKNYLRVLIEDEVSFSVTIYNASSLIPAYQKSSINSEELIFEDIPNGNYSIHIEIFKNNTSYSYSGVFQISE